MNPDWVYYMWGDTYGLTLSPDEKYIAVAGRLTGKSNPFSKSKKEGYIKIIECETGNIHHIFRAMPYTGPANANNLITYTREYKNGFFFFPSSKKP